MKKKDMKYIYRMLLLGIPVVVGMLMTISCSGDSASDIGDEKPTNPLPKEMKFLASTGEATTRSGEDEPTSLHTIGIDNFIVYGINGTISGDTFTKNDKGVVFPNYKVWYEERATTNPSSSNSSNWEYVGVVGEGSDATTQSIKYWDDNYNVHYFWAIAPYGKATFTEFDEGDLRPKSVTISDVTLNNKLYFTEQTYVLRDETSNTYKGNPVELKFKSAFSKIRIGFYEAIEEKTPDGNMYYITDIQFYQPDGSSSDFNTESTNNNRKLYLKGKFPETESLTLNYTYTDVTKPTVTGVSLVGGTKTFLETGTLTIPTEEHLSTSSLNPTYVKGEGDKTFFEILPYTNNDTGLTLKCDYKMNNYSETKGVYATVPVSHCQWEPNKAYTYIFKISPKTSDIVLMDVKIEDWEQIESSNNTWTNW